MAGNNKGRGALVSSGGTLHATRVIPDSAEVRLVDALITTAVGGGAALWTATRPTTGGQLGWAAFLGGLGLLAAVEGRGSILKYGGFGLAGSQAAFLILRFLDPNLQPHSSSGNATANYAAVGQETGYMR